jgi:hypothetical protein
LQGEDTDDDMNFMKVCTYEVPLDKKFSKNWLEYLKVEDFYEEDKPSKKEKLKEDENNI